MTTCTVRRTIAAPRSAVFRAWLEPSLMMRWLGREGVEVVKVEVDERVGGGWRLWQTDAGEDAGGFECEILELVADERIVLRWRFVGPDRDGLVTRLSVDLTDAGEGTEITLQHSEIDELMAARPEFAARIEPAWTRALERLDGALS